jgi:hypothetical protein
MPRILPVLIALAAVVAADISAARAETVYSGVLSPQDAEVFCSRVNKPVDAFSDGQYGCVGSRFRIACKADLTCVAVTNFLEPNYSPMDRWLGAHGFHRMPAPSEAQGN